MVVVYIVMANLHQLSLKPPYYDARIRPLAYCPQLDYIKHNIAYADSNAFFLIKRFFTHEISGTPLGSIRFFFKR